MKKILLYLSLIISCAVSAQLPSVSGFTNINQKYQWYQGIFYQRLSPPADTATVKIGLAQPSDGNIYKGNGSWWTVLTTGPGTGYTNPMTTLGDIIKAGASGIQQRLAGNATTVGKLLRSIGDGTNVTSLDWATESKYIPSGELPGDGIAAIGNGRDFTNVHTLTTYTNGVLGNGCPVTWTGSGLVFHVGTPCIYNIGGVQYNYPGGDVTLPAADASNPRFDDIVVTTSTTATYVQGVAQTNPEIPDVNETTQLYLTSVFVDALATTPSQVGQFVVRDVNYAAGEWYMSRTATIDSLYNTTVYHATNSVRLTAATNGQYFQYNSRFGTLFSKALYNNVILYIRNNSALNNARVLQIRLFNGITQVGATLSLTNYGYSKSTLSTYMTVAVPMSAFGGADAFNAIRITNTGTGGTVDVQFDYVQLQSGIVMNPVQGSINRFGVEDNRLTFDRNVSFSGHKFSYDSIGRESHILNGGNDSAFIIRNHDGTKEFWISSSNNSVHLSTMMAGTEGDEVFVVDNSNAYIRAGHDFQTNGNNITGYQNTISLLRRVPMTGDKTVLTLNNNIEDVGGGAPDSSQMILINGKFTGPASVVSTKFKVLADGTIYSALFPSGSGYSTDSVLVVKNGIISVAAAGGGGGGGGWPLTGTFTLTGNVTGGLAGHTLVLGDASNYVHVSSDLFSTSITDGVTNSAISNDAEQAQMSSNNEAATAFNQIRVNQSGLLVTLSAGNTFVYAADYFSGYTDRSLIDFGSVKDAAYTITNKRWKPRVDGTTSSATPTINTDNVEIYELTAQTVGITSFTTNLSGTPNNGDMLEILITGTAARAITWGSAFVSTTVTLPTTTVTTATLVTVFQYHTTSSYGNNKWLCVNTF